MQQDEVRSADLGRALLLMARAELAQGDTAGAKEDVRRSMPGSSMAWARAPTRARGQGAATSSGAGPHSVSRAEAAAATLGRF